MCVYVCLWGFFRQKDIQATYGQGKTGLIEVEPSMTPKSIRHPHLRTLWLQGEISLGRFQSLFIFHFNPLRSYHRLLGRYFLLTKTKIK